MQAASCCSQSPCRKRMHGRHIASGTPTSSGKRGGRAHRLQASAGATPDFHFKRGPKSMDAVDTQQHIDIEKLISHYLELKDRVEEIEGQLDQLEERSKDRAVALRAMFHADQNAHHLHSQHSDDELPSDHARHWDSYRNSFTLALSTTYIRAVDSLRNRLMATEYELGLRPIALQTGVSRFEAYCASSHVDVPYEVITALYEDPTSLEAIEDPLLRMHARSIITQADAEARVKAWEACTVEAQRLATQFSEAEFISKLIPDPFEHGVIDSLKRMISPVLNATHIP